MYFSNKIKLSCNLSGAAFGLGVFHGHCTGKEGQSYRVEGKTLGVSAWAGWLATNIYIYSNELRPAEGKWFGASTTLSLIHIGLRGGLFRNKNSWVIAPQLGMAIGGSLDFSKLIIRRD